MDNFKITPTPIQEAFITNTARYSCMSGGFGSGKTIAGCLRGLVLSSVPNNVGLIGRLTYPELRDTTRKSFFEVCPPEYYDKAQGGKWSPTENYLRMINGSEVLFRHLDTVSEKELLSLNIGWFYIDQAEEINGRVFQILMSRLRLAHVPRRYGFVTCNPEPSSWIYEKFVKPQDEGKPLKDHHYISSSTLDNPHLPADYIESLLENYPEEMKQRYIEGRWDVFENQIYKEFNKKLSVIRPFKIPDGWERIVSVDHGMVNPTAALFGAIDYDGNVFIYDEYYAPGVVSDHAKSIISKTEGQDISFWLIDPSTKAKTREKKDRYGNAMPWSVIEEYEDYGLWFTPANNEILAGINRVKEFFKPQEHRRHPVTRERNAPRLYIFQNCVNLLFELPQYQWRKMRSLSVRNEREQPRDYQDHACFIKNTMIHTKRGMVPIQNVTTDDHVFTPFGWSRVLDSHKTGRKKVRDYGAFTSTPNHPVLTNRGLFPVDVLRYDDKILVCKPRWLSGTEPDTEDIHNQKTGLIEFILNALVPRNLEAKQAIFTKTSGNIIMAGYPKIWKSIILMATHLIMISQTWKLFLTQTTQESTIGGGMMGIWNILKTYALLLKNGTKVLKGEKFTVKLQKRRGKRKRKSEKPVLYAENNTARTFLVEANTVIKTAKRKPFVKDVYNLRTENGMYFANGVLVSNCDALRYLIMSRFPAPLKRFTGQEIVLPEHRKNSNNLSEPLPENYQGDEMLGYFHSDVAQPNVSNSEI